VEPRIPALEPQPPHAASRVSSVELPTIDSPVIDLLITGAPASESLSAESLLPERLSSESSLPSPPLNADFRALLAGTRAESGRTLLELVDHQPVLLVFLRHFGCAFCRQAIEDVANIRAELEKRGVQPVFVHLGSPERARPYFDYYHLSDVERISNPDGSLYAHPAFLLARVSIFQIFRPAVWIAWLRGAARRHGIGMIKEDVLQMPGVFLLRNRAIARVYRHRTIADRPDYLALSAP
jgi:hypothetical protein